MSDPLKEMAMKDHMTHDERYNRGLKKLRLIGSDYWFWNDDIHYYLYCNGIGYWK